MKKVRFESIDETFNSIKMNERECHSPRPVMERQVLTNAANLYSYPKVLPYNSDPVQLFECSNSSPYPLMNKTKLPGYEKGPNWSPSNDLELSMLDASCDEPQRPDFCKSILKPKLLCDNSFEKKSTANNFPNNPQVFSTNENKAVTLPNVLVKDDNFFIRKDNLNKFNLDIYPLQKRIDRLSLDKENDPFARKAEIMQMATINIPEPKNSSLISSNKSECRCHHCIKIIGTPNSLQLNKEQMVCQQTTRCGQHFGYNNIEHTHCSCMLPPPPPPHQCHCCNHPPPRKQYPCNTNQEISPKLNAVDKKTWAIEKYEQSKKSDSMEVEKQTNVTKEKREPTVSDLFKIIKLQNEQLQLLQEKVDKFISASQKTKPAQNSLSEHVSIQTVDDEQHKISIGVMTSFEMVRTSTIINKEVLKTNDNAQIQCNRSQISIKEVVSKAQAPNLNFLDGIAPVEKAKQTDLEVNGNILATTALQGGLNEEKTFNEMSLYNVQVDNATTPLMSPEQSLYLDVRDYSDSDADSDQSNVGWTYYNKVMTHVNGMLQDSDMPSSASAMYRNTRQQMQTVQMQIDKTNVSVTKRVKFGDDPLGLHQPHIYASTDTSLKMNQLAAKYLNNRPAIAAPQQPSRPATAPIDMSFATRNYMEKHKLLQGVTPARQSSPGEMPRFLDITALKQQPKFL